MKGISFLLGAMLTLATVPALAADVVVDDFEAYTGTGTASKEPGTLREKWAISTSRNDTIELGTGGGAVGNQFLQMKDEGFGITATGADLVTPTAGNYRLTFYYKNGNILAPMRDAKVRLLQGGNLKAEYVVPFSVQANWTAVQTPIVALTAAPVTVQVTASNPAGTANQINVDMAYDEFKLVEVVSVPLELSVFPDDRIYLSRTETIVASPSFGSGTYMKVEFDVNNDGTVDHTDTSAPFEFVWNTLNHVPQDTSRTLDAAAVPPNTPIPVKITVTDSTNQTATVIEDYTVDNRFNGRESLVTNGNFTQWQAPRPTTPPITLPVAWEEQWTTSTAPEVGPAPDRNNVADSALRIRLTVPTSNDPAFSAMNFPDRYTVRSAGKKGNYRDLQTYFWGRGAFARMYYLVSRDGGATYATSLQDAGIADGAGWTFAVEAAPQNGLGLTDNTFVALGTHVLGTTEHFFDDVVSEGMLLPETTSVGEWKLY